ncbi:MAG TPA: hypothetical protein VFV28_00520 [Limnobacter sp.]|nr:hypothetical protein [Limnobacter sp.]
MIKMNRATIEPGKRESRLEHRFRIIAIFAEHSPDFYRRRPNMNTPYTPRKTLLLVASASLLLASCIVVPIPSSKGSQAPGNSATPASASNLCNIEGQQVQDLSEGTTKATITQSCQETSIQIQNRHPDQAKRCKVLIGNQSNEVYIRPGESRSVSQAGPVEKATVQLKCMNETIMK